MSYSFPLSIQSFQIESQFDFEFRHKIFRAEQSKKFLNECSCRMLLFCLLFKKSVLSSSTLVISSVVETLDKFDNNCLLSYTDVILNHICP